MTTRGREGLGPPDSERCLEFVGDPAAPPSGRGARSTLDEAKVSHGILRLKIGTDLATKKP